MRFTVMRLIEFSVNGHKPVETQSEKFIKAGGFSYVSHQRANDGRPKAS